MNELVERKNIKDMIYEIRGKQVMLDSDLAKLYGTLTGNINRAVKRNPKRFPVNFYFQLNDNEYNDLLCQNGIAKGQGGRQTKPFVFTQEGVAMLSAVLKTEKAEQVSVNIMNAFVEMRKFISSNSDIFKRMIHFENTLIDHDNKINQIIEEMNPKEIKEKIFYDGEIYDAYSLLINIIREAKEKIIIIDNYIDKTIFDILSYKNENIKVEIWTKEVKSKLDYDKFNLQYENVEIKKVNNFHDRFIIIDDKKLYHLGASLKDLGKKCFAINQMNKEHIKYLINSVKF